MTTDATPVEVTDEHREAAHKACVFACAFVSIGEHGSFCSSIARAFAERDRAIREECAWRAIERAHDLGIHADKQQSIAAAVRARGGK